MDEVRCVCVCSVCFNYLLVDISQRRTVDGLRVDEENESKKRAGGWMAAGMVVCVCWLVDLGFLMI